ncbi:MAG: hypothetical protein RLY86_3021 [Pseudomonadota bacterium]|jgi:cyclopropane fatty-acyl-phospholipid synthase-like methyltransferase
MWQVDCAVNTAKALLPFQQQLRAVKRRLRPPVPDATYANVLSGGFDHVALLTRAGLRMEGARILELGSGWFPIIPLMLRVAGAGLVHVTDVHRLIDRGTILAAVDFLYGHRDTILTRLDQAPARLDMILSVDRSTDTDRLLADLGLTYIVPFDPAVAMPDVDAVISQTVLEHIPPPVIEGLFRAMAARMPPGTLMSHGIDNTDHRANKDPGLNRFDFLRYSDKTWRMLCLNPQDYTNRLRHSDYLALFPRSGHRVVEVQTYRNEDQREGLARLTLDGRFAAMDSDDLLTGWSHIVSRSGVGDGAPPSDVE